MNSHHNKRKAPKGQKDCLNKLTELSFNKLMERLKGFGNNPGEKQRYALKKLLGWYTNIVQKEKQGRIAFPLPTGMGKTQSIVAFVCALHELGLHHISIAVCQNKVEALCDLKRDMMDAGIPEESIGLLHSYSHAPLRVGNGKYASLPSNDDAVDRPYLLCTHKRIMEMKDVEEFNTYMGTERDLLIWDESLIKSAGRSITMKELAPAFKWLKERWKQEKPSDVQKSCLKYLDKAVGIVSSELQLQKDIGKKPEIIKLPELTDEKVQDYKKALGSHPTIFSLHKLLEMSQQEIRVAVLAQQGGGVITYDLVVPHVLRNIVILDASYLIRELCHLDTSITFVEDEEGESFTRDIVSYENVTIHQVPHNSGRGAIHKALSKRKAERLLSKEIAEIVKWIPESEGVLLFTFKEREGNGKRFNYAEILRSDLESFGVDVFATLPTGEPRFNWLTWGNETSLSEFKFCSNVILVGVLHRSRIDLSASMAGQQEALLTEFSDSSLGSIERSELTHCIYQAVSRGRSRVLDGDKAKATNVWLTYKKDDLRSQVEKVMPGVGWKRWEARALEAQAKYEKAACLIVGYMRAYREQSLSISVLKREIGLKEMPNTTFVKARDRALKELPDWKLDERSLKKRAITSSTLSPILGNANTLSTFATL